MADRVKVTVEVTGGIAAYKAVEVVRLLQDAGFDPHVVMTSAAERFDAAVDPCGDYGPQGHLQSAGMKEAGASGW